MGGALGKFLAKHGQKGMEMGEKGMDFMKGLPSSPAGQAVGRFAQSPGGAAGLGGAAGAMGAGMMSEDDLSREELIAALRQLEGY